MTKMDRVIFSIIAAALTVIALNPWIAPFPSHAQMEKMDVNIVAVGGRYIKSPGLNLSVDEGGLPVYITGK